MSDYTMVEQVKFSPERIESTRGTPEDFKRALSEPMDRRDGAVYVYNDDVRFAVQIALAASRPLLVRGDPGTGKSTLAASIARILKWRYYETVITSHIQARDLQWSFDAVRRLADAEAKGLDKSLGLFPYVEPGILWWAFNPASAKRRGLPDDEDMRFPAATDPGIRLSPQTAENKPAVALLDEIDKADPDVPNDLLVALGSLTFTVREIGQSITADRQRPLLVVITTNEERDLPPAFLRRCVQVTLSRPATPEDFAVIARAHFGSRGDSLYKILAKITLRFREAQERQALRPVSTAEYLDAVRACIRLNVKPPAGDTTDAGPLWNFIGRAVLKNPSPASGSQS